MPRAKDKKELVWLVCEESGARNYILRRRKGIKLRLKKYCPKLRKHTWHAEKRK